MSIGKNSIARAAKAVASPEEKEPIMPALPEEPVAPAPSAEIPAPKKRGRKPGTKNKPKPAAKSAKGKKKSPLAAKTVIANVSPEVVEKVAKPKMGRKAKSAAPKMAYAIGDELPEYLL